MIEDLDKALRQLLIRELKNGDVKIEFKPPVREWSNGVNRPTLNLFLHDVRENKTLRQSNWDVKRNGNGRYTRQRTPVRLDLYYLITAWAKEPDDEHRILTRTLAALFRNPILPEVLLPESLRDQPAPIQVSVAQYDLPHKLTDVWSVLDNEIRPGIDCMITMALNPFDTFEGALVHTRELAFGQAADLPEQQQLVPEKNNQHDRFWMVGGVVRGAKALENVRVTLLELGLEKRLKKRKTNGEDEDPRFIFGNLNKGRYTLEVSAEEQALLPSATDVNSQSLVITAREGGPAGNDLSVTIVYGASKTAPGKTEGEQPSEESDKFTLIVNRGGQPAERFPNLTMGSGDQNVARLVNQQSKLISIEILCKSGKLSERRPAEGEYALRGLEPTQYEITVPSKSYDIEIQRSDNQRGGG